ncbi:MAG: hypothetical protein PUP91_37310 [Rhizonema sp. PD37]|nr:hypothetical protein [Rhizonema sp. PD37]
MESREEHYRRHERFIGGLTLSVRALAMIMRHLSVLISWLQLVYMALYLFGGLGFATETLSGNFKGRKKRQRGSRLLSPDF